MFGRNQFFSERHSRMFEKGDLKYVVLDLLKDKPSHGYEIIRAMEERFMGFYTPSAGSIYPTLQLLEDMGYVKALEQDGKKVYSITEEGKSFLKQRGKQSTESRVTCGSGVEMLIMTICAMRQGTSCSPFTTSTAGPMRLTGRNWAKSKILLHAPPRTSKHLIANICN